MSLLLLFNGSGAVHASASITEANDSITAAVGVLVSPSASLIEADDNVSSTAAVLVSTTASITEADDGDADLVVVGNNATANLTEGDDQLIASALSGGAVATGIGGAGGYIRRVKPKPIAKPKPVAKPKPLDRRTVQFAVREQDDAVVSAATVNGQSLAAALALAEAQAARKIIEHNNNFLMAA
jgi:hypothetical protein